MVDIDTLERLVTDIFVDSFKQVSFGKRNWNLSPFNVQEVTREIEPLIEKEYRERVPHSDEVVKSLDKLSAEIKEAGGITRQIYKTYHFALNAIARTLTRTDTRISGGHYSLEEDDRRSREIGSAHSSLADDEYGEMAGNYNYKNIFGNCGEGTLFQREYNESDRLIRFRIFHQLHRSSLKVATVDISQLQERVEVLIKEKDTGRRKVDLSLPYDADTFAYDKLVQFNEQFGNYVRLNVLSIGGDRPDPLLVVEFNEDHQAVGDRHLALQEKHGVALTVFRRDDLTTLRREGDYRPLDFYARSVIDPRSPQNNRLDRTGDEVLSYLIIGNSVPEFFPQLLKSYILDNVKS